MASIETGFDLPERAVRSYRNFNVTFSDKSIVISVSDTRNEKDDVSGITLVSILLAMRAEVVEKVIVSDDLDEFRAKTFANGRQAGRQSGDHDGRDRICRRAITRRRRRVP